MHEDHRLPLKPFISGYTVSNPQFSPNGRYLAYIRSHDAGKDLVLYDRENATHLDLIVNEKISTGTAYGGETYAWAPDSQSIVFSLKGKLHRISTKGGVPEPIPSIDKSFHPKIDDDGLYFIVEHEKRMSVAQSKPVSRGYGWPSQVDLDYNFLYDPVRHPDGTITVHAWDYPHMSWDGSQIIQLQADGKLVEITDGSYAVAQPRLNPENTHLSFFSEETGWLNLWVADSDGSNAKVLVDEPVEHSYSTWVSGNRNQIWLDNEKIIFTRNKSGRFELTVADLDGNVSVLDLNKGYYSHLSTDGNGSVAFVFSDYSTREQIAIAKISEGNSVTDISVVAKSGIVIDQYRERLVQPEPVTFPTKDGGIAHGLLYCREDLTREKLPLLILVHGGPTGMFYDKFRFDPQYFADQGWLVVGVNYRGSIGYGREFRQVLNGKWGDYDVDDCIDLIDYLDDKQWINPQKVAIMGGSAGGYTTLMSLVRHPGRYAAGINLFGVADMFLLAEETHYLEAHYLDMMIGPLPETAAEYRNRSPIYFADKISDPILILQGELDPVVPKNQSELIFEKVKGIKEIKIYPDEGHGFTRYDTLYDMYSRIDKFLRKHVLYS